MTNPSPRGATDRPSEWRMKMRRDTWARRSWVVSILLLAVALAASCGDDDDESAAGDAGSAGGGSCQLASDCASDEYCLFTQQDLATDDRGACLSVPDGCQIPVACGECEALFDPCPEPVNRACSDTIGSDFEVVGNPIVTCQ